MTPLWADSGEKKIFEDLWDASILGPRDWSPRLERGLRMIRQLHDLFPKYMLDRYGDLGGQIGDVRKVRTLRGDEKFLLAFVVTFERGGPHGGYLDWDGVWITRDGVIEVGSWVRTILTEGLPGYESLADRWPFVT
jgi:hypothetical protein